MWIGLPVSRRWRGGEQIQESTLVLSLGAGRDGSPVNTYRNFTRYRDSFLGAYGADDRLVYRYVSIVPFDLFLLRVWGTHHPVPKQNFSVNPHASLPSVWS
jgi:hypothetical protein